MARIIATVLLAGTLLAGSASWALGPFIIFFDAGSARIPPQFEGMIDSAVRSFQDSGTPEIELIGSADRAGNAVANRRLSLRRAERVKAALVARGYPAGRLRAVGTGETRLLVATKDGVDERQNRFVMMIVCSTPREGPPPRC